MRQRCPTRLKPARQQDGDGITSAFRTSLGEVQQLNGEAPNHQWRDCRPLRGKPASLRLGKLKANPSFLHNSFGGGTLSRILMRRNRSFMTTNVTHKPKLRDQDALAVHVLVSIHSFPPSDREKGRRHGESSKMRLQGSHNSPSKSLRNLEKIKTVLFPLPIYRQIDESSPSIGFSSSASGKVRDICSGQNLTRIRMLTRVQATEGFP